MTAVLQSTQSVSQKSRQSKQLIIYHTMFVFIKALLITGLLTTNGIARDVPSNIQALYNSIRAQGSCANVLKGGFYSQENDTKGTIAKYPTPSLG